MRDVKGYFWIFLTLIKQGSLFPGFINSFLINYAALQIVLFIIVTFLAKQFIILKYLTK